MSMSLIVKRSDTYISHLLEEIVHIHLLFLPLVLLHLLLHFFLLLFHSLLLLLLPGRLQEVEPVPFLLLALLLLPPPRGLVQKTGRNINNRGVCLSFRLRTSKSL